MNVKYLHVYDFSVTTGELAQMVERLLCVQEILGSISRLSNFYFLSQAGWNPLATCMLDNCLKHNMCIVKINNPLDSHC